jgi:hypothetical protein
MPSSYDINQLRTDARSGGCSSLRAHEKEISLAPALVSQEAAEATGSSTGHAASPGGGRT